MSDVPVGYKQTDVGVIPEDWEVKTLKELTLKIQDGTHFSPKLGGNDFLYLTSKNIRFGYIDITNIEKIDAEQHQSIYKRCDVKKGDLLLTKDGANTGNAAINPLTEEFSLLSSVAFLRFSATNFDARYFLQQILSHKGQERISEAMSGNAITRLTLEKINKLKVSLPPTLTEQTAIATALSDVDALLNQLDKLIAKKRDIKQATMQQLLTGKKRLAGFSGEWEVKKLGDVASPSKNRIDPKKTDTHEFCIELEHIQSETGQLLGFTSTGEQSSLKTIFNQDDILFGKLRAYLRKYWYVTKSGICSTEIWALTPNQKLITSRYLFQIIQTDDFIDIATMAYGTHMPRSDWNIVKNYEVSLPPIEEQTAIATLLTDMDTEITQLQQRRHKTHALKQGMMQQLLTGKIRLVAQ